MYLTAFESGGCSNPTIVPVNCRLWHPTGETGGILNAARAVVARYLRVRTEWPGADAIACRIAIHFIFRGNDRVRSRAVFHPVFQRSRNRRTKTVWSRTT